MSGGLFLAMHTITPTNALLMIVHKSAFYALLAFLIIYALSFAACFPRRDRYLPHAATTLAEVVSWAYESPVLDDTAFKTPKSKTDLVTRLLSPPPGEKERGLFAFGVFRGVDGKEHLGIERMRRRGGDGVRVISGGTFTRRRKT